MLLATENNSITSLTKVAAFLGKILVSDNNVWKVEVTIRCPFGRRPDRTYYAVSDDGGNTFMDSSSAQPISDASLVSRLRDRINAEKQK